MDTNECYGKKLLLSTIFHSYINDEMKYVSAARAPYQRWTVLKVISIIFSDAMTKNKFSNKIDSKQANK